MEMNTQEPDDLPTESRRRRGRPLIYASTEDRRKAYNARRRELRRVQMSQQEAVEERDDLKKEISDLRIELQQVSADRDHQLELVQSMIVKLKKLEDLNQTFSRDMDNALMKAVALEETCSSQQDQIQNLNYQLATANEKLKENEAMEIYITDLEHQLVEAEKLRKKQHNTILELKGNIRVFCRVRPIEKKIDGGAEGTAVSYPTNFENLGRGIILRQNAKQISFTLDKVFDHEASQENVFVEISELVQSALDGYKVCIFAYGQTGSGKTYTMMGKPEDHEEKGLIPRVLEQLFEASQSLKSLGWHFNMQVSMLEIYNETIRDLLLPSNRCANSHGSIKKESTIRHDPSGNTHVSDISVVDVCLINEVYDLLNRASQNRSVGKTQMNEQSSRSHFVFTLRISGVNDFTKQQVQGILNLIDLAGSERLAKSGATGACLKETQAINKSLSTLNLVIVSIAKKEGHVPYRNSKLTWLLQPCLSGDSKILMFVNISPEVSSASESICSLQFAERLNAYQISAPRRHTKSK